ncbi:MAG: ParB/RepB/Spo0J family partition protein [Bacteroidales bacterium]
MKTKKSALGRGLSAILESPETDITSKDISGNYVVGAIANIPLEQIEANPFQPRDRFEEESLRELANSIKEKGIIQPVTVRKLGYEKYQLISGERRFKASKIAGLTEIPCYIRVANDQQMLELALIENIHRKDLNPVEIAISYQRLIEECNLTQEELSKQVGKDRSTITNFLRLLKLPVEIQIALREEKITAGHARALLVVEDTEQQNALLQKIIREGLSVREVERLVKGMQGTVKKQKQKAKAELPEQHAGVASRLEEKLHAPIEIKRSKRGNGMIMIRFRSDEEFERITRNLDI